MNRPVTLDSVLVQPIFGIVSPLPERINSDITNEMDRRTKQRLDLQLVCRVGASKVLSAPASKTKFLVTENFSRSGILLRWLPEIPLPAVGGKLTVDVDLPCAPGVAPRLMRCTGEVVRIERTKDSRTNVGIMIGKIRFVPAKAAGRKTRLEEMAPATPLLN